ncbi:armadillo-type protein [Mycena latifolia]|nr:armadillo-type protein [Mycena latifolia]
MPPLRQHPTRASLESRWSNNNPPSATIPLHTLAKPLAKLLHNRQALRLLRKYRALPLSKESLDVMTAYLAYKGISKSTKLAILSNLQSRSQDPAEARKLVISDILPVLTELLNSSNHDILAWTCRVLGNIACWKRLRDYVLDVQPCSMLSSLLRHSDASVRRQALYALHFFSFSHPVEADRKLLRDAAELLASLDDTILEWTCELIGNFCRSPDATARIAGSLCLSKLVSLNIKHPQLAVRKSAAYALCAINGSEIGAVAIGQVLATSQEAELRESLLVLGSTSIDINSVESRAQCILIVSLLRHHNRSIQSGALLALGSISCVEAGAQAMTDVNAHLQVSSLLNSVEEPKLLRWGCLILGNLASHQHLNTASLTSVPRLVALLGHTDLLVQQQAVFALSEISHFKDGASAILRTDSMKKAIPIFSSSDLRAVESACRVLCNLVEFSSSPTSLVKMVSRLPIFSLIGNSEPSMQRSIIYALRALSSSEIGSFLVGDARFHVVPWAGRLLESSNIDVLTWTCDILGNLCAHDRIDGLIPVPRLASLLLFHEECSVQRSAAYALCGIQQHERRALSLYDLTFSPYREVLQSICRVAPDIIATATSIDTLLLISGLLKHRNLRVHRQARVALGPMTESNGAASAIVTVEGLIKMLDSSGPHVLRYTSRLLGDVAQLPSAQKQIVELVPRIRLKNLLRNRDARVQQQARYALRAVFGNGEDRQYLTSGTALLGVEDAIQDPPFPHANQLRSTTGHTLIHRFSEPSLPTIVISVL